LSGAAVRYLAAGMARVTAIDAAISASNRAAAGRSVATAILSSVGQPVPLWRGGRSVTGYGWQDMRREHFDLADGTSLGRRRVALADVPDLELLPERVAGHPAVMFRAGTELGFQNIALWLASWPIRWFGGSLRPFARWLLPLQSLTATLGSDRSGMVVRVFGVLATPVRSSRSLTSSPTSRGWRSGTRRARSSSPNRSIDGSWVASSTNSVPRSGRCMTSCATAAHRAVRR
jgi:hypothetical protein